MMTNDEFWAKFQTLYESVENDNILYKQGTVVNCFDDGESYNSFFKRALGYILDLAKDGDYKAQLVFNSFVLDNMHIMYRIREVYDKLQTGQMKDNSQFSDGMFMKAYVFKNIDLIVNARRGRKKVINADADFVYETFTNKYSLFNWEEKEKIYDNKIKVRQKLYKD